MKNSILRFLCFLLLSVSVQAMTFNYVLFDGTENHPGAFSVTNGVLLASSTGLSVGHDALANATDYSTLFDGDGDAWSAKSSAYSDFNDFFATAEGALILPMNIGFLGAPIGHVYLSDLTGTTASFSNYIGLSNTATGTGSITIYSTGRVDTTGTITAPVFVGSLTGTASGNDTLGAAAAVAAASVSATNGSATNLNVSGSGNVATIPTSPLSISYSGSWFYPLSYNLRDGSNLQISGSIYKIASGKWVDNITYNENTLIGTLVSCTFNDLAGVYGTFTIGQLRVMTSISAPLLTYIGGSFSPSVSNTYLTNLYFPLLIYTGGFSPNNFNALTSLSFPSLIYVNGAFTPSSMSGITTFNFPNLSVVNGNFAPSTFSSLTAISLPSLTYITGNTTISSMAALTTLDLHSIIGIAAAVTMNSGLGNLTNVTIGTVGITKMLNGSINISGQKLTQSSVDGILAVIASLDGTNGTTSWGSGKTLTINGGTNSAPSSSGSTSMATIVARGGTVTHN